MEEGTVWEMAVLKNCIAGNLEELKRLITVDNVNTQINLGCYGVHYTTVEMCCYHDRLDCVKWLIEDMNANLRASLYFCMMSLKKVCADYILKAGADVNMRCVTKFGETAIYVANNAYTRILLEANANVHVVDDNGYTPLATAFRNFNSVRCSAHSERIYLLMQYGAKIKDIKLNYNEMCVPLPVWMTMYQQKLDGMHRKRQAEIGRAFLCVSRKKKVPKDLARDVVKRMILPNEDYFYESVTKKSQSEPK